MSTIPVTLKRRLSEVSLKLKWYLGALKVQKKLREEEG